jgi:hypothetical protein
MEARAHRQIFRHHPRFGRWYVPSLRARVPHERGGYFVVTNAAGARCTRDFGARRPGVPRVLVLGDSFSAGDGVDNAERYSDRLEAMCPGIEVLNLSLPGSGTDQQALIHEAFADELDPDVLVVAPLVENIRRNVAHFRPSTDPRTGADVLAPKPYFTLERGELVLHQVPVPHPVAPEEVPEDAAVDRFGRFPGLRNLVNTYAPALKPLAFRVTRYQPHKEYDTPGHPDWLLFSALLRRIFLRSRARVKVLMPLPYNVHIEELCAPNYLGPFRALGRDLGVPFVDLLARFFTLSMRERRRCRSPHDHHYTPMAHDLVARALSEALAPHGVLRAA